MDKKIYHKNWNKMGMLDVNYLVQEQPTVHVTCTSPSGPENGYHSKICPVTYAEVIQYLLSVIKNLLKCNSATSVILDQFLSYSFLP